MSKYTMDLRRLPLFQNRKGCCPDVTRTQTGLQDFKVAVGPCLGCLYIDSCCRQLVLDLYMILNKINLTSSGRKEVN